MFYFHRALWKLSFILFARLLSVFRLALFFSPFRHCSRFTFSHSRVCLIIHRCNRLNSTDQTLIWLVSKNCFLGYFFFTFRCFVSNCWLMQPGKIVSRCLILRATFEYLRCEIGRNEVVPISHKRPCVLIYTRINSTPLFETMASRIRECVAANRLFESRFTVGSLKYPSQIPSRKFITFLTWLRRVR